MPYVQFWEAPDEVIEMAQDIIKKHHSHLEDARVGFVMRDVAPRRGNLITQGYARCVSKENQLFMPFDFIITLCDDCWQRMTDLQRRALIDHELCHCGGYSGNWKMRDHDFEEFMEIIDRYGFWRDETEKEAQFIQSALVKHHPLGGVGKVNPQTYTSTLISAGWRVAEEE